MSDSKDNRGALWPAEKAKEKSPDYTGERVVGGKRLRLVAWDNGEQPGTRRPRFSLALSEFRTNGESAPF